MAKAAPTDTNGSQKMIPADCVSVLLMALDKTSISKAQYEMMSALDGTRTASSFEHQFRTITAKAKQLKSRVDQGEKFEPVPPTPKRGGASGTAAPTTPKKRKNSNDEDGTPSKKKPTSNSRSKKTTSMPTDGLGGDDHDLSHDMDEFIKHEQEWENGYA